LKIIWAAVFNRPSGQEPTGYPILDDISRVKWTTLGFGVMSPCGLNQGRNQMKHFLSAIIFAVGINSFAQTQETPVRCVSRAAGYQTKGQLRTHVRCLGPYETGKWVNVWVDVGSLEFKANVSYVFLTLYLDKPTIYSYYAPQMGTNVAFLGLSPRNADFYVGGNELTSLQVRTRPSSFEEIKRTFEHGMKQKGDPQKLQENFKVVLHGIDVTKDLPVYVSRDSEVALPLRKALAPENLTDDISLPWD
jgi:hypothetical protein